MSSLITRVRLKQISQHIENGKRLDERGLHDYRPIKIEQGIIEKAEGSARIYMGKTEVLVGVKVETGEPFPDTPNEGVQTVNAELVPLASPDFEPGPPDENSIELARIVDRGLRESHAIDTGKLCVEAGKKVFVVFVDVYVLNHDGNLIDASALAALAALMNTKLPNYEYKNGELKIKQGFTQLPMKSHPITVTIVKINNQLVIDPQLEEEKVMDSRISIAVNEQGNICAVQKGGSSYFTPQQILEASKLAQAKAAELRKKFNW
ncbi:MAG: exosome complex protein Rrp42 [Nitrososphaerota archaeon]|jgi:exosome complex component RRP42|uniref:exosome complex protein Rrp42 n=1 Tax=Candidatus Bathycorpusculum sp. TaxID=2994959 RepID=UPI00282B8FC9|nr:exosome complex protein Rrp42 [Candidatus Termiticorpusculum sp.]MCL2256963.1 exosome complex protein Rrp42 [Candidatus Termiticorpusculum sp.]MCL2292913.1 exosome complex protein Rrp42 [Candidatus Termiticorpusculum sp.]MDR0460965.1 exosome complex protein Rrp42 [Nitrososphaerota archaeon]